LPGLYVPPDVDDSPPLLDWVGVLAGDVRPAELFELLFVELDELDEEPDELLDELDELVPDDSVGLLDVVCVVAPGRTAMSAPVTATLAKDTVMVVALRRRLPCSRSATARAISRLFMSISLTWRTERIVRGKS
jgi:hypothetical protein